jgi:transcriptional regulator with XRE-family HTH domain
METAMFPISCHYRYMDQSTWLRGALERAELSQAELARQLTDKLRRSIDRAAVNKILLGKRDLSAEEMIAAAQITGAPIPTVEDVPLVGYVGAGSEMHYYEAGQGGFDDVPGIPGATPDTVAVEIRGDSLGSFFDHWLVYYDRVERPITSGLVGKLCVVGVSDGRVLIKKVQRSKTAGLYHLLSQSGEPPITDVEIDWAAVVKHMAPR